MKAAMYCPSTLKKWLSPCLKWKAGCLMDKQDLTKCCKCTPNINTDWLIDHLITIFERDGEKVSHISSVSHFIGVCNLFHRNYPFFKSRSGIFLKYFCSCSIVAIVWHIRKETERKMFAFLGAVSVLPLAHFVLSFGWSPLTSSPAFPFYIMGRYTHYYRCLKIIYTLVYGGTSKQLIF